MTIKELNDFCRKRSKKIRPDFPCYKCKHIKECSKLHDKYGISAILIKYENLNMDEQI